MKPVRPVSLRSWNAPGGRPSPEGPPAPRGSSVTEAGIPATTQCQKPLPVGASGSKQVTAKPAVSGGNPDQRRWGLTLPPPAQSPT